jgi:hypothetical protein
MPKSPLRSALAGLALFLFATASLARAQTDERKLDAVKSFRTYVQKSAKPADVIEALHTLKANECPEAAGELMRYLGDKDADIRNAALTVFSSYHDGRTFQPYIEELGNIKNPSPRRAMLVELLGKAKVNAALPVFADLLKNDKKLDLGVRYQIARAIPEIGSPKVEEPLTILLKDPEWQVREAAADAVDLLAIKSLGKELVPLINDPERRVQSSAVKGVGKLRPAEAIDPLIELMRKPGVLQKACSEALYLITDLEFGIEPDAWAKQMKTLRAIEGWHIPTDEDLAKKKQSRELTDEKIYGKARKKDLPGFVGILTTSTNVLFIIDVSGSMEELVVENEKFKGGGYKDFKKFTIVQTELLRTIDSLKDNTNFNIISFATELDPWKKGFLVPANNVNKDNAKSWVKSLRPLGGVEAQEMAGAGLGASANVGAGKTNTYKALMAMFNYDPDKQQQVAAGPTSGRPVIIDKENKLDTVYFLSDGRPSHGKFVDTKEIAKEVNERNKLFKIVLHTIAIGEFQKDFMKELAAVNGGVFVDLGK